MEATTVFDFGWRMRARSHYGDPAMFYAGTLTHDRSRLFAESIRLWTGATMSVFEALVAQGAPALLEETATRFIARDRSEISARLITPRLQALGLFKIPF
jgi:hypothetical protein